MPDPEPRPSADELKQAVRGVRNVLERLPETESVKKAHEHLEKVKDFGLRGVEDTRPAGLAGGEVFP